MNDELRAPYQETRLAAPTFRGEESFVAGLARRAWAGGRALIRTPAVLVLALTVGAAALRGYRLEARGLWFDELVSAYPVRFPTLDELWVYLDIWLENTPLVMLITWLLRDLGGSEAAIRLPFVVAGVLNIPAIYLLGNAVAGRTTGLIAALGLALAPFAVYYSQEARPYAFLMLFTTLQLLFTYRAIAHGGWRDWLGLALCSILNLYTGYLALAPTLAAGIYLGLALLGAGAASLRATRRQTPDAALTPRQLGVRLGGAVITSGLVFLGYQPWLPRLQAFLDHPGTAFNRFPPDYQATWADAQALLAGLGLTDLWLALVGVGVLTGIRRLLGRQWRSAGLFLLLALGVPLGGFVFGAGEAILRMEIRHFAVLFPQVVLLLAVGVDSSARLLSRVLMFRQGNGPAPQDLPTVPAERTSEGRGPRFAPGRGGMIAYLVVLLLLVAGTTPALARSYDQPKQTPADYRQAAAQIMAASPPGSLALALGTWGLNPAPTIPDGVEYYLWRHRAPVAYVDGSRLHEQIVQELDQNNARVWGVVYRPAPLPAGDQQRAAALGLEIIPFQGLTLVSGPAPGPPQAQINTLLRWATDLQPGLVATRSLLDPEFQRTNLGANLLPPLNEAIPSPPGLALPAAPEMAEQWLLRPGATRPPDREMFVLRPGAVPEAGVTVTSRRVTPGPVYVLRFRCRNPDLHGKQLVHVTAYDADRRWIDTYPPGAAYQCAPAPGGTRQAFAFALPPATTQVGVWLRATGQGQAEFDQVELRAVR